MESAVIEDILKTTGMSIDDLFEKIQKYKTSKSKCSESGDVESKLESSKNEEQCTSNNSVILASQSSNVENISCNSEKTVENKKDIQEQETGTGAETNRKEAVKDTEPVKETHTTKKVTDNSSSEIEAIEETHVAEQVIDNSSSKTEVTEETHVTGQNVDNSSSEIEETLVTKEITDSSSSKLEVIEETCMEEKVDESHPTISDHDYSNPTVNSDAQQETSFSSLDDSNELEKSPSNTDDLRNIIRMQLSSLRNKKKGGFFADLEKKSMFFHSLKKKRKSCEFNPATPTSQSNDKEEDRVNDDHLDGNSLASMSDDTDFVITDVRGGVEIPDSEPVERSFAVISDICSSENKKNAQAENDTNSSSPKKQIKNILTNYRRKMSLNYFDTNRYNFISSSGEKSASLMVKKNFSENFSKDPGINKSVKNSEKSPFVSDSLDDFLNESSQLKISYPIPKLGAEEGITENTKKSPFDNIDYKTPKGETNIEPDNTTPKEKPKIFKPKTLAEMRRQFEKLKAKQKSNSSMEVTKSETKGDNATQSSRVLDTHPDRNCFIMYNNKKLFLSGKINDKCVGVISSKPKETLREKEVVSASPKSSEIVHKKPSLLSSLTQNKSCKVNYKPGPLCKKIDLQNTESRDTWKTELKTLPKVFLEVVPQVNHPVDPKLVHLLPVLDDTIISEERANFALSVLQPKNKKDNGPKSFSFYIPYNNKQDKMLVRKRFKPVISKEKPEKKEESDPSKEIASILDGIINYVEVKEIEDTLIKEDDTIAEEISECITTKTKGRKAKRKKLDLELLRLSCKVIDVATTEMSDKDCSKPYCRLGCVCKSLLCESIFSNHCQLVECMFGCKCPPITSNEALTANNSLSAHTVNHLEDKAKKNLAKVEREFTQTIIHTDNDVILVGTGKVRRSSKPPKKYDDYIGNDEIFDNLRNVPSSELKNCAISLEKIDLSLLKPFCLQHKVHNCTCKGEDVDYVPSKKTGRWEDSPKKAKGGDQIPKIRIVKTKEDQHKAWYDSCARIRTVFPEYKERNKNPVYNEKLHKRIGLRSKYMGTKKDHLANNEINFIAPPSTSSSSGSSELKKPSKRKQSFTVREDVACDPNKEYALQRRKKKLKADNTSLGNPIFEGEIKVCLKDNKDILDIIGRENASLEYLRILPWSKLIENFRARKLSIWSKEKKSSALLCNAAGYFPPKNFVDIRIVQQKSEIVNWILTDTLPPDYPRELMHLILTPKKCDFLIAGYCLKKLSTDKTQNEAIEATETSNADQDEPPETSYCGQYGPASCASPKSSESRSSFEEISVDSPELVESQNRESEKNVPSSGKSVTSVLKSVESRSNEVNVTQQSVLIRKLLNTETNAQPVSVSPPKKLITQRKYEKISTDLMNVASDGTKQNLLQSKSGCKQIEILKSSQKSVMLATGCKQQLEPNNRNVKLKSILNPIPSRTPFAKESNESEKEMLSKAADPKVTSHVKRTPKERIQSPKKTNDVQSLIPSRSLKCTHKDKNHVNRTLVLTHKEFAKRKLYCNKDINGGELAMSLPKVPKTCTWWMIYLNSDFSFLNFVKANYSIKYTDLMDVVKMSNNTRSTITLRNKEFTDQYKHPMFGIYCVPEYQDRLFLGPYVPTENQDVETLRYMQGRLVNTKIFNTMMRKEKNLKKPMWIHETPVSSDLVIDITEEEDREVTIVNLDSDEETDQSNSLLCPPFVELLTSEELKSRNINRYIVTNIPHLGYFGACQRDSRAIEVFWPSGDIGYRFPNVILAKNLLIHYLTQVFCPIPQDFKVNVIIMTHIDTQTNTPVDPKYFSGKVSYFCGEFGICEKLNIPDNLLKKHNIRSVESLLKSHQESKENEGTMTRIFGLFLMSNEELLKHSHTHSILQWAISEIYILKKLAENYESEKTDLKNMIHKNTQKLKEKREGLITETIEITDSDEENNQKSNTEDTSPAFKKICVSGKINPNPVFLKKDERSLLKPKIWVKSGLSLLKSSDKLIQDGNKSPEKSAPAKSIEISLNNSNIVLDNNKMLITKIK